MSAISTPFSNRTGIRLDVFDIQTFRVKPLKLSIADGIPQEMQNEMGRLLGPSPLEQTPKNSLSVSSSTSHLRGLELLSLAASAHAAFELPEGHAFFTRDDVL